VVGCCSVSGVSCGHCATAPLCPLLPYAPRSLHRTIAGLTAGRLDRAQLVSFSCGSLFVARFGFGLEPYAPFAALHWSAGSGGWRIRRWSAGRGGGRVMRFFLNLLLYLFPSARWLLFMREVHWIAFGSCGRFALERCWR
jgi:hypothetical protein